jgi:hypothetical protein
MRRVTKVGVGYSRWLDQHTQTARHTSAKLVDRLCHRQSNLIYLYKLIESDRYSTPREAWQTVLASPSTAALVAVAQRSAWVRSYKSCMI